jgi:hypothetical protein
METNMTAETPNEPNEFGFSGGATAPQPDRERAQDETAEGEDIAVPAGDLTGSITDGIDEMTHRDDASH